MYRTQALKMRVGYPLSSPDEFFHITEVEMAQMYRDCHGDVKMQIL